MAVGVAVGVAGAGGGGFAVAVAIGVDVDVGLVVDFRESVTSLAGEFALTPMTLILRDKPPSMSAKGPVLFAGRIWPTSAIDAPPTGAPSSRFDLVRSTQTLGESPSSTTQYSVDDANLTVPIGE